MSFYQELIARILKRLKRADVDPCHVEAWMRLQYGALDNLDARTFTREVKLAVKQIDYGGKTEAEELARSYGLRSAS